MKDRIVQIMKSENMTQQDFAAALDISPSTLSSIFNDRTQPSLAIVNKIHDRFPNVNLMWLLYGQGEMYMTADTNGQPFVSPLSRASDDLSGALNKDRSVSDNTSSLDLFEVSQKNPVPSVPERVIERVKYIDKPSRRITEINVYFDDGTYEVFVPRKKD